MNVAFIPVRGGSKSIILENIKSFYGRPLIYWTINAAQECNGIDKVYVAADSDKIKEVVDSFTFSKVEVVSKGPENTSDIASTESIMLEFADKYSFDNIILIQAASPLLTSNDLNQGMNLFMQDDVDSVFSAVRQRRFYWQEEKGYVNPMNYDYKNRPNLQELEGYLVENGAFYITSRKALIRSKCRLSGRIKAVEMSEDTYYEIDEPSDWIVMEELMKKRLGKKEWKLPQVKMFLTDSDGCLTDGGMYYSENGDEIKKFNTKDGMGFELLKKSGIITGIITGEERELVKRRADKLHLDICEMGVKDKYSCISGICKKYEIDINNVLYIGDDINDLEAVSKVGVGCCVSNANESLKASAKYVSNARGGEGAIREIADWVLRMNEKI